MNYIFAVLNVTLKRGKLYKLEIPGYGMEKEKNQKKRFMVSRFDRSRTLSPDSPAISLGRGSETHLLSGAFLLGNAPTPFGGFLLIPISPKENAIKCTPRDKKPAPFHGFAWLSVEKPYFPWAGLQLPDGST